MTEVDEQIARARATMARISEDYRGPVAEKLGTVYRAHGKRLKRKAVGVGTRFAIICVVKRAVFVRNTRRCGRRTLCGWWIARRILVVR